jgi:signal transduction histidine kinase
MTEAIERTLEPHSIGVKIAVRFNVPRERLTESTTHAILHIVRELAVNAIRHDRATMIKIAGECHDDTISFSVKDNGCGFDPDAAPSAETGHFGLLGIRERLKEFGGSMTIESEPEQGAKAIVKLTIEHDPHGTMST